ncbi:MAG: dTMP kinase [Erysipelotrichales bacterium]|nr:dTMP kinase [Erysipelotrichales bacterium]
MRNGIFITFEGPDGSGKTTISTYVADELAKMGYDVIYSREPGGIDIAEQIRNVVLNPKNTAMDAKTEALLYAASRRQHFVEKIKPALENGKVVICDRFVESSLAYQGYGRGIGIDEIYRINEFAIEGWLPDATFFLDLSPEAGLGRIETRANKDRLDQESNDFHDRVYEGYQEVLRRYRHRITVIDASQDVEAVKAEALRLVLEKVQND